MARKPGASAARPSLPGTAAGPVVPAAPSRPALLARFDGAAIMAAVFISGAVLLGVEIAASRVLAPSSAIRSTSGAP